VFIVAGINWVRRGSSPKQILSKIVAPFFFLFGLFVLRISTAAMQQYIQVCAGITAGHAPRAQELSLSIGGGDGSGVWVGLICVLGGAVALAIVKRRKLANQIADLAVRWGCVTFTAGGLALIAMNL
jgi:hypothetical protein